MKLSLFSSVFFLAAFVLAPFRPATAETFNVGVIIPLSGDLAEYGTAIRNGFQLAEHTFPSQFSNIRFVYEDSRYDGKTAVAALQKLRATNSINVYYLWGVSPTEAMLPVAAAQKRPVIAETTVKEAIIGKPLVIRAARTGERIATALANELEARNAKSVSFLVTQIPFYTDIVKHLVAKLQEKGITVNASKELLPSDSDLKPFLTGMNLQKEEYVGVFLLPAQLISFFRQANQMNRSFHAFNADLLDSNTIVEQCPENIEGTFFTQVGVTREFRTTYESKYLNDIQIGSAAQSYDVALLIRDLFGSLTRKLTPEEVITAISSMAPRTGATGTFHYSETPDAGKEIRMPVSMKVVRNRKLETLTEDSKE